MKIGNNKTKMMMRKFIFCLLALVGSGILYSCQQDDFVSEAPKTKGVTITASMPTDPQSRVVLGEMVNNEIPLYWEETDVITVNIGGTDYTFSIVNFEANSTTATFYCAEIAEEYLSESSEPYVFKYGTAPTKQQSGTIDCLYMEATVQVDEELSWDEIKLNFKTAVSIVEVSFVNSYIRGTDQVWLYDENTSECLAYAVGDFSKKNVYFAVTPGTYKATVWLHEPSGEFELYRNAAVLSSRQLVVGKLYHIDMAYLGVALYARDTDIDGTNVKYYIGHTGLSYIYGTGEIPARQFENNVDMKEVIIFEGITYIGSSAFEGCTNLTSVTIPGCVSTIDDSAFSNCSSLKSLIFTSVTPPNFNGMTLESSSPKIYVPIGATANYQNTILGPTGYNLDIVEVVEQGTMREDQKFTIYSDGTVFFSGDGILDSFTPTKTNPTFIKEAVIQAPIFGIMGRVFQECTNLTKVTLSASMHDIESEAFSDCI